MCKPDGHGNVWLFSAHFLSFLKKKFNWRIIASWCCVSFCHCCCPVTKLCPSLYDPVDCSTPDFPVLHYLLEFAQIHGPLSQWCHPTISSSVNPFFCPQSFPASGSFWISRLFASGGQSIGASAIVLPVNIQGWFPLELTALVSLLSKGLSRIFSNTTVWKHQFFGAPSSLRSSSHLYTWLLLKP